MLTISAVATGVLFVLTAAMKTFYSRLFIAHVRRFNLLPEAPSALMALLFIELEAGLGAALVLGLYLDWLIPIAFVLVLFFTVLTWWGGRYRDLKDCGCYGGIFQLSQSQSLLVNVFLLLLLATAWLEGESYSAANPRNLYFVIAVILLFHLAAKKSVKKPLIDLLGLKVGKPWKPQWYDIDKLDNDRDAFLFFILSRDCLLCRKWIQQLSELDAGNYYCRMVILLSDEDASTYRSLDLSELKIGVYQISRYITRFLTGQLPMAVFVEHGRIVNKQTGSFPWQELALYANQSN